MKAKSIIRLIHILLWSLSVTIVTAQVIPNGEQYPASPTQALRPVPAAYAGTNEYNTVSTWMPSRPFVNVRNVVDTVRKLKEVKLTTQYIDGLGRPLQTVQKAISVTGKDLVQPVLYDNMGRESVRYLPYVSDSLGGKLKVNAFSEQANFMQRQYNPDNSLSGEKYFYGEVLYEASPDGRTSGTRSPGNSWVGSNRGGNIEYGINESNEVRQWSIGASEDSVPVSSSWYAAGRLTRTATSDEHGKRMVEYKDKQGHIIMKKVEIAVSPAALNSHAGWLSTYYVYDAFDNLRYVIQPKGTVALTDAGWVFDAATWQTSTIARELCFCFAYDARGRMILKRIPGAGEIYLIYDQNDKLVMSQDANLRANTQWLVTQYDVFSRPVKTYLWNDAASRGSHINSAANSSNYPTLSGTYSLQTATYYDDYSWVATSGSGLTDTFHTAEVDTSFFNPSDYIFPYPRNITPSNKVKGLVTGTQMKVLGSSNAYLFTVNFYDDRSRHIQALSTNILGGIDIATIQYSFEGKVLASKLHHRTASGSPEDVKVFTKNTYDEAGRLLMVSKRVNEDAQVMIVRNEYDELGQMLYKKLGQQKPGGEYIDDPIETLKYDYNIKGWLTGINRDYALSPGSYAGYFGEQLNYDFGFSSSQYNGNVSGIVWSSANDLQPRAYGYSYDAANRLLKADFTESTFTGWNTSWGTDYTTTIGNGADPTTAYDENGNIKKMTHFVSPGQPIDVLNYSYDFPGGGNRLKAVTDSVNNPFSTWGDFKEIVSGQAQDYSYDPNGNMTSDQNKGIASIIYNHLNLPELITVDGKGTIEYTYDAAGNKLRKIVTDATNSNTLTTTTYISGFQYENDDLKQLGHEEGRIRRKPDGTFVYDYYIKDHLGSVRVTLTEEETVDEYRMASMELDSASSEETYYSNLAETRTLKPTAYPDRNDANKFVAKLDGKQKKVGPAILLKVMAGDRINIQAKSWYKFNGKKSKILRPTLLEQAVSLAGEAESQLSHTARNVQGAMGSALVPALMSYLTARDADSKQINGRPKAYLNWVLLDENLKPFREDTTRNLLKRPEYAGFQQVGEEQELKQHLKEDWKIAKSGYVYIFTSNESEDADVYFEDFGLRGFPGPLLEVNHTYPFGLAMMAISSKAGGRLQNRMSFNGKELQNEEFSDGGGLELYDYGSRMHDPQLGRWWAIDPKVEKYASVSPYNYALNNPVKYTDPEGEDVRLSYTRTQDKNGNVVITATVSINLTIVDSKGKMTGSDVSWIKAKGGIFGGNFTTTYKDAKGKEHNVALNVSTEINLSVVTSVERAKGTDFILQVVDDIPGEPIGLASGNVGAVESGTIPKTFPAVALHELGHELGLDHVPNTLMEANVDGKPPTTTNTTISNKDRTNLWKFLTTLTEGKTSGVQNTMTPDQDTRTELKKFITKNYITP